MITLRAERESLDKKRERNMRVFLDKIYKNAGINFVREYSFEEQLSGIDVYFNFNNQHVNIDEKVATSFYARQLKTFCLELEFTNLMFGRQKGWFHDKNNKIKTDAYIFGYVAADDKPNNDLRTINSLEVMLVKKHKLWQYINNSGYNSANDLIKLLYSEEKAGRTRNFNGRVYLKLNNGLELVRTDTFEEQPISILVPKDILTNLSSFHTTLSYENEKETYTIHKPLIIKQKLNIA